MAATGRTPRGPLLLLVPLLVVVVVAVVVVVKVTLGSSSHHQKPQVASPTAPLTAAELSGPIDYVALGDSYSAGPGLPTQRTDPAACARSTGNYAAYLASWLQVRSYRDVTCTGATTDDVGHEQIRPDGTRVPPQVDALSPSTDLVTISLGGNDSNIFETVVGDCPQLQASDPAGHPCQDKLVPNLNSAFVDDVKAVQASLVDDIRRVRAAAPNAQVVVVGYPQIFGQACAQLPLATGDVAFAAKVVAYLVSMQKAAAVSQGVRFVDLIGPSTGHSICSTQPWMNGPHSVPGGPISWHPFPLGMQGAAGAIYRQLTGHAPPSLADTKPLAAGVAVTNPS